MLRVEIQLFWLAVQFLTRLPVPRDLPYSDDLSIRALRYYPLVGALVGLIGAAVLWAASGFWPAPLAVLLSVTATILVTGALHEDGLADAMDGLIGGPSRDRALAIMRDSRVGSYGALALGLSLALKVLALLALPVGMAAGALVVGHGLARLVTVQVIATAHYARSEGAKFKPPTVTPDGYRIALATGLGLLTLGVIWMGPGAMLVGAICAGVFVLPFRLLFMKKLGGYTGDCLGGVVVLAELGFYLGLTAWL